MGTDRILPQIKQQPHSTSETRGDTTKWGGPERAPRDRNPHHRSRRITLRHSRTRSERITTDPYREREPRSGVTGEGLGNQKPNISAEFQLSTGEDRVPGRAGPEGENPLADRAPGSGVGWEPLADREPQTQQAGLASESRHHRGAPRAGRAGAESSRPRGIRNESRRRRDPPGPPGTTTILWTEIGDLLIDRGAGIGT